MFLMTISSLFIYLFILQFNNPYSKFYVIETTDDKIKRTENNNQPIHIDTFYGNEISDDKIRKTENSNQSIHLDEDYSNDTIMMFDSPQAMLEYVNKTMASEKPNESQSYKRRSAQYKTEEGTNVTDVIKPSNILKEMKSLTNLTQPKTTSENITDGPNVTDVIKQLDIVNNVESLINLTEPKQISLKKELDIKLKEFEKNETDIKKAKLISRFVTSTPLADQISRESRLFSAVNDTILEVSKSWDTNSTKIIGDLVESVSERFEKSAETGQGLRNVTIKGVDYQETSRQCDTTNDAYRTINGKCNNIAKPNQGSAIQDFKRFLNNSYEDGESIPRGGFTPSKLPSARLVSTKLHQAKDPNPLTSKGYTVMVMQFGQFLDHDITFTSLTELDCCKGDILSENPDKCFNIDIRQDRFYRARRRRCHEFTRSSSIFTKGKTREQMNMLTSYIDASGVYGSDDILTKSMRELSNGKLKTHKEGPMLPSREICNRPSSPPTRLPSDLLAGDERATITPNLASIHTLFLNEHNRVAEELKSRLSDFLSAKSVTERDEILYQEARKIIGAEIQNIVYNEFLPIVLGTKEFNKHNLKLLNESQYDNQIDASIRNEFATTAFRFGHTLIPNLFEGNVNLELRLNYFDEDAFYISGPNQDGKGWQDLLLGICKQKCPADDLLVTRHIRNFLFAGSHVNGKSFSARYGDDLIARNIQRGRDHGIPSYNHLRSFCNLNKITDFTNTPLEIKPRIWRKLKRVYDNVDDIDGFTGGLSETTIDDGLVGPTFACIIGKQFNFLKFGDRYFFNNALGSKNERGLKLKSRESVQKRALGDIICDNTDITELQKFVMKVEDKEINPYQKCNSRNGLDFDAIALDISTPGPETLGSSCNLTDLVQGCSKWKSSCGSWWMTTNCAKTCKCPEIGGSSCSFTDLVQGCSAWKSSCGSFWMTTNCEKTCKC